MKKIIPLAIVVVAIIYFMMTCGESKSSAAARKHCHCGEALATVAAQAQDSLQPKRLLQAYNEMLGCLGGEEEWKGLRRGKSTEYAGELLRKLQEQCPQVLETLQKLGIYSF